MEFPSNVRYTKDHEWIRLDGDIATVGITDFAQGELGEIVHVDLPTIGTQYKIHETLVSSFCNLLWQIKMFD